MSTMHEEKPRKASGGIRITLINVLLILFGLILSAGIISSTYRTENTFHSVYSTSDTYMISQQTTGMLDTLSASMKAECRAFLEDGDPSYVHAFSGQLSALNEQLEASAVSRSSREDTEADLHLDNALAAFLEMNETELRAMRLAAETRKVPVTAYPELLQNTDLSEADRALSLYREYYRDRGLFENALYPGIPEALAKLKSAGKTVCLATSKPEPFARRILEHFSVDGYFDEICGATLDGTRETKAAVLRELTARLAVDPADQNAVMIGDRRHDAEGAREIGIPTVGVLWGYGSREELEAAGCVRIAETPEELASILL